MSPEESVDKTIGTPPCARGAAACTIGAQFPVRTVLELPCDTAHSLLHPTDVIEFHNPAGKVCLPPVVDCSDGMLPGWPISTSPDANVANSSLSGICGCFDEESHARVHLGRGDDCRWPGWIKILDENGPVRSASRKGARSRQRDMWDPIRKVENGVLCGYYWAEHG